jgi:hypothetical protein
MNLRRHIAFVLLMLVAAPLMLHFVWHPFLSSMGDDSVSYLTLARWIAGTASPSVLEWVPYQTTYPPLFPLALALSGASTDFLAAHLVVGAFAILALPLLYRYAGFQLGDARAGLAVVVFFLLTPTAWASILSILSESLFLLITLAALHLHATRIAGQRAATRDELLFGFLLGLAFLTRSAAAALIAAYAAHASIAALAQDSKPRRRFLLPFLPLAAMAVAWTAWRPAFQGEAYGLGLKVMAELLRSDPSQLAFVGAQGLAHGWIASFASQPGVHPVTTAVILAVGALAVCGAVMRARRNALDGWYALASLAMLFLWFQPADTARRLLYPLVPVLLVHAAGFVRFLASRVRHARISRALPALVALPAVVVCLPALYLVHAKSFERAPAIPGFPYSLSGVTELYTGLSVENSRISAARHIALLVGLQALQTDTPTDAKVMWMRPDYVALLGNRRGVPWFYPGGIRGLAEGVRDSGARYVIVSNGRKTDLHGMLKPPFDTLEAVSQFAQPVSFVRNVVKGNNEFGLMLVDPERLAAFLAQQDSGGRRP